MAYNLQPLITILEGILDPDQPRCIVDDNNLQLQSLLHKATSLQHLLDKSPLTKIDSLESQIREMAHQAEDIIESHMVDQMRSGLVDQMRSGSNTAGQPNFGQLSCCRFNDIFCLNPTWLIKCISLCSPSFTFPTRDLQQVTRDLQQVTRDLDSVTEQLAKLVEVEDKKIPRELDSSLVDQMLKPVEVEAKKMSSSSSLSSKSVVVGIDEDLMELKDRLTGMRTKLEIVPIVGMGGVGKTTLARKLYEDPSIISHFEYGRAWATISQDYNMPQILISLLSCIIKKEEFDQHKEKGTHVLKDMLYKRLYGRKYLIVLDDIWSSKFWDEIRMYFPDNKNGSRIMITTRETDVANYASSSSSQHQVQLLGESESWNLLHQLVFGEEECPLVLHEIGQKIAKDCGGLPLAISVIGGLLSKMERSEDVWEKIGDNVIAAISESDGQCYSILSLSYNHLPNHLKPCFLYMGAFPEDFEISGSTLIQLWVAEGFVKSNGERSLEEEAEDWLKSLIKRNLFLVKNYKENGKPKSYSMHDMLRDLCIRKCDEDKFMYVKNGPKVTVSNPRRVSLDVSNGMNDVNVPIESKALTRSFICFGYRCNKKLFGFFSALRLLRVLYFIEVEFNTFPSEIFEFVNLHCLVVKLVSTFPNFQDRIVKIPRGISRLRNLQTLIAPLCEFDVPSELWQLYELRNLKVYGIELLKDEEMKYSVMKKLQRISMTTLTEEESSWDGFFKSIPNIKRLAINDQRQRKSTIFDLSHLHNLKILICRSIKTIDSPDGSHWRSLVIFPCHIRKLVLDGCIMNSRVSRTLCALHKLEALTIKLCFFVSDKLTREEEEEEKEKEKWEVADGEVFCSLQFLSLRGLNLVHWIANETNFPRLRHLYVDDCWKLEEIPSSIGEIPTLQIIDLQDCNEPVEASAERIVEEQSENGNYDIELRISKSFDW